LIASNRLSLPVRLVLGLLLAAYFLCGLAYVGLRYYVWPRLDQWRPQIVEQIAATVGRPVAIGRLESGFEGPLPRLTIDSLRIDEDDGTPALQVRRATAVLSLSSFLSGELRLDVLQLESPRLRVERIDERRLRVAAIDVALDGSADGIGVRRLLSQRRILVHDAVVEWVDRPADRRVTLEGVELAIGNVGRRHRVSLSLGQVGDAVGHAHAAFEVYRAAGSAPLDWRHWSGQAYAGIDGFDAQALRELLPLPLPLQMSLASGQGDLKAWATLDDGRLRSARLKLAARDLEWRQADRNLHAAWLEADIAATHARHGYAVRVQHLQAQVGESRLATLGEQTLDLDEGGRVLGGRLSLAPFDAAEAVALARELPLEAATLERLARLRLAGRVKSLDATWRSGPQPDYDAAIDFDGLSLRYSGDNSDGGSGTRADSRSRRAGDKAGAAATGETELPWFENLSGEARVTPGRGQLRVRARNATLGFPGIFAEPAVPLQEIAADATWTVDTSGEQPAVAVEVGELRFANADAAGVVKGSYRTGGKGPGVVDLQGALERADVARVARYLPLQIEAPVREWAQASILGGRSSDARFRLRGDLYDFPYGDPRTGEFSITAQVVDGVLNYAPGWPQIERFQGTVAFERLGMRIQMRSGAVFGVRLSNAQATIRDFAKPTLLVEGAGEGPASDMLRFVNESPVATRIDDFTRDTQVRGDARLAVKLTVPLDDLDRSEVAGSVRFLGNDLRLDNTIPPFSGVSGALEFTDQGLALRDVAGTFLDGPLRVRGETPEPGRFLLQAEGTVTARAMRAVVDNPLTQALAGAANYRARNDVRRRASTVTIESDLAGLSSSLPAPLAKAAAERWPLVVSATPEMPDDPLARPRRDEIRVALGHGLRMVLQRERDPKTEKLLIRRGSLALNAEPVLRESGLSLVLNETRIDVDAWTPLLRRARVLESDAARSAEFAEGFSLMPSYVSATAPVVRVGGKELHDVVLGASRLGGFWSANVSSNEVSGFFNWRDATADQRIGTLSARFTRLVVPRTQVDALESLLDTAPSELPALDVVAEEFVLFDHALGRLELRATNSRQASRPGWLLESLRIANRAAELKATGSWAPGATAGVRPTRLQFALKLADSGGLLEIYGLHDVLRGGAGRIEGDLHWIGSPMAIDYPSLGGEFKLDIGKGQFLKADPGIAKLIGVLSLQALPRRLTLDFKDVFAEGFAFDRIAGDVAITHGIAKTSNLEIRGPQAQVRIRGEADIGHETQALTVEVRPELGAGIAPLAYGAMVNPVIGIGAFVAQLALRGQIEQILAYEYDVTGTWTDPQVVEKRRVIETPPSQMP